MLAGYRGGVEVRDVRFAFPRRPDRQVLDGFSLRVEPGQVVGLVGASGSGKSAVLSLLMRFYRPQSGMVLLDGVDAEELDANWVRGPGVMAIVSQDPALFATTVAENIRYGRPDASDAEVATAAAVANAAGFIERMPGGYETYVGERGQQLSGGQRQRIAIARAVLTNPKVLLLDEATSALDSESEALVQEALMRISAGRTVIKVAHRLNTVRNADIIAVLESGRVVEMGTHDELVAARGSFYSLMRSQKSPF